MTVDARSLDEQPSALVRLLIPVGRFFFTYRNAAFPVVLITTAVMTRPHLAGGSLALDRMVDGLGLTLALAGQALRVLVIGLAYIKRGGKDGRIYAKDLVTEGIFAHSRNPLYVGNLLVISGLVVIHGGPWMVGLVWPFFVVVYLAITLAEEDYLRASFGDAYDRYCDDVPRYLPRLSGLGATIGASRFDWAKVLRKEYGSTLAWTTAALALFVWEAAAEPAARTARLTGAAAVWLVLVVAWATIRVLKKRGHLGVG